MSQSTSQAAAFQHSTPTPQQQHKPPPFHLDNYATTLPMMAQAEAFATQISPRPEIARNPAAYQARRFRAYAKDAENVSQYRALDGLLDVIVNGIEDLPNDPQYVQKLADWKDNFTSLESRVDQVQKPPINAPVCQFRYATWTLEEVASYLYKNGIPTGEQQPALVGHCYRDRRPTREATHEEEPAVAEVFARKEGTVRDPDNPNQFLPARRGELPKFQRGPYKAITYDAPLINTYGNNPTEERKCYIYTTTEKHSEKTLNMVATLQSFVYFANNNGYSAEMNTNFLRTLLTQKDPTAFRPFEDKTPQQIVDQLIRSYYITPPDDESHRLRTFQRKVGDNIQTTMSDLENILQCHFRWLEEDRKKVKVQDELTKCLLLLIHPALSEELQTERAFQLKNMNRPPNLQRELSYVQDCEITNPHYRLKYDLPLNTIIEGLQLNFTATPTNFDMSVGPVSYATEKRSRDAMENETNGTSYHIRNVPRQGQLTPAGLEHKRQRSTPPPYRPSSHDPHSMSQPGTERSPPPPSFRPTAQRPPTPSPPPQPKQPFTSTSTQPVPGSPVGYIEPTRGRTQSPNAGYRTPGGTRRWLSPRGRNRFSQSPTGNIRKYDNQSRSFNRPFNPYKDSLIQFQPSSSNPTQNTTYQPNSNPQQQPQWPHQSYAPNYLPSYPPDHQPSYPPMPASNQHPDQNGNRQFKGNSDQQYDQTNRARSRSLSRDGRPFQYRYTIPTSSDISWILRTMDRRNYDYWQHKHCDKCNSKGHGSVICPDYTCPKCYQVGVHQTVDHCALVKHKLATILLTTKRLDAMQRSQSRSPSQDPYHDRAADRRHAPTRYETSGGKQSHDRRDFVSPMPQRSRSPAKPPQTYNVQIPEEQIQTLAKHLSQTLCIPPGKRDSDFVSTKN